MVFHRRHGGVDRPDRIPQRENVSRPGAGFVVDAPPSDYGFRPEIGGSSAVAAERQSGLSSRSSKSRFSRARIPSPISTKPRWVGGASGIRWKSACGVSCTMQPARQGGVSRPFPPVMMRAEMSLEERTSAALCWPMFGTLRRRSRDRSLSIARRPLERRPCRDWTPRLPGVCAHTNASTTVRLRARRGARIDRFEPASIHILYEAGDEPRNWQAESRIERLAVAPVVQHDRPGKLRMGVLEELKGRWR